MDVSHAADPGQAAVLRRHWHHDRRPDRLHARAPRRSARGHQGLPGAAIALQELEQRAAELGGNAIVGVDLDYEVLGQANGMLMVSASGTAVVVELGHGAALVARPS